MAIRCVVDDQDDHGGGVLDGVFLGAHQEAAVAGDGDDLSMR
jgi:hypothetical protein